MAYGLTQSLRLTGASSEYTSIADNASLSITGNITIEFWVKLNETLSSGQYRALVVKSNLGASNRGYELLYGNVGGVPKLLFYFFTGGLPTNFFEGTLNQTLTSGTWYHIAMTCTVAAAAASKMQWYINGVSQGSGTGTNFGSGATAIFDSTLAFRIGQSDPVVAGYYPDANFSLVRIWDTIRSSGDISANMCNVLGSTANLKAEWTFNGTYLDNSGNGNTLTGINTPTAETTLPSFCAISPAAFFQVL